MFNGCHTCGDNKTHGWDGTNVDYTTCVDRPTS